jgi:hypothetical protein
MALANVGGSNEHPRKLRRDPLRWELRSWELGVGSWELGGGSLRIANKANATRHRPGPLRKSIKIYAT